MLIDLEFLLTFHHIPNAIIIIMSLLSLHSNYKDDLFDFFL